MRLVGIEYPKVHDVSDILIDVKERFPKWFKDGLNEIVEISKSLASKREIAFYGFEEGLLSPEEAIGKEDAEKAVKGAVKVYGLCKKLYDVYEGKVDPASLA